MPSGQAGLQPHAHPVLLAFGMGDVEVVDLFALGVVHAHGAERPADILVELEDHLAGLGWHGRARSAGRCRAAARGRGRRRRRSARQAGDVAAAASSSRGRTVLPRRSGRPHASGRGVLADMWARRDRERAGSRDGQMQRIGLLASCAWTGTRVRARPARGGGGLARGARAGRRANRQREGHQQPTARHLTALARRQPRRSRAVGAAGAPRTASAAAGARPGSGEPGARTAAARPAPSTAGPPRPAPRSPM